MSTMGSRVLSSRFRGRISPEWTTEEGGPAAMAKMFRDKVSAKASKASLVAIFCMATLREDLAAEFVDLGMVPLLLDALVDCDKSTAETIVGVLDALLGCRKGKLAAYEHALAVPLLVKKILRVSPLATGFAVSALWKLLEGAEEETKERARASMAEAIQLGAFQKLLLLLQVGCSEATKGKASALLKLMNSHRRGKECIESADFKAIKRSF
ncbi:U-box domain-containing protein 21-like [Wolffia australiana]